VGWQGAGVRNVLEVGASMRLLFALALLGLGVVVQAARPKLPCGHWRHGYTVDEAWRLFDSDYFKAFNPGQVWSAFSGVKADKSDDPDENEEW
jgi:hypothetical protein